MRSPEPTSARFVHSQCPWLGGRGKRSLTWVGSRCALVCSTHGHTSQDHRFPSEERGQAGSGRGSTMVGGHMGRPGAVFFLSLLAFSRAPVPTLTTLYWRFLDRTASHEKHLADFVHERRGLELLLCCHARSSSDMFRASHSVVSLVSAVLTRCSRAPAF
eukprot:769844-Prymnesium_polylepis.1